MHYAREDGCKSGNEWKYPVENIEEPLFES